MAVQPPRILVVDDQPMNVKLLERKLAREGMEVFTAFNGVDAITTVRRELPDLILLDVMMPDMDGIEVCHRLKERAETRNIPVIFITARTSKEGKLEGLDAGGADYITKPIDLDETLARVNTQLRIQENHQRNLDLQSRLADARHAASIGAITQGIAHNLNNLLGIVVGYIELLRKSRDKPDKVERCISQIDSSVTRMVKLVRQLTSIASNEQVRLTPKKLRLLLESSIERYRAEYGKEDEIRLGEIPEVDLPSNAEVFEDLLGRLLINAWESYPEGATERPIEVNARIRVDSGVRSAEIHVNDQGRGLDEEIEGNIFDPFVSGSSDVGRGMGLTVARHSIRGLGGDVQLFRRENGGTQAILTHPL